MGDAQEDRSGVDVSVVSALYTLPWLSQLLVEPKVNGFVHSSGFAGILRYKAYFHGGEIVFVRGAHISKPHRAVIRAAIIQLPVFGEISSDGKAMSSSARLLEQIHSGSAQGLCSLQSPCRRGAAPRPEYIRRSPDIPTGVP